MIALLTIFLPLAGAAQTSGGAARIQTLKAAVRVVPPFVAGDASDLKGFSVDLLREIAKELGAKPEFVIEPTLQALLESPTAGRSDLAIAAISITADREQKYDFSHPMFEGGLQIMVRPEAGGTPSLFSTLEGFFSARQLLEALGILFALIVIPAHIVWLAERGKNKLVAASYFPGIFNAIFWATGAAGGQQYDAPSTALGRLVSGLWVFVSVLFVAYFTAAVTTAMTVQQLKGSISGPGDLPGKIVATVGSSTAEAFLRKERARVVTFQTIELAFAAPSTHI